MSGLPTRRALRIPRAIPGAMVAITGVVVMVVVMGAGRVVTAVVPPPPPATAPPPVTTVWRRWGPSSVTAPSRSGRRGEERRAGSHTNINTNSGCDTDRFTNETVF